MNTKKKNTHQKNLKKTVNTKKVSVSKKTHNKKTSKNISQKNNKKVIIVHGWYGDINKGWFPWLKKTLEEKGYKVIMESMPNPDQPQIDLWTETLKNLSGKVDEQTYFVGHSIGCQTILRMLEKHESPKAGGAIFLAGWFNLTDKTYTENPKSENSTRKIAQPWISTEIDFSKVQPKFFPGKVTAIFSDNDPYVDISNAEAFKQKLGARIVIETNKGHYEEEKIDSIPLLVEEILRISEIQNQNNL